MAFGVEPPPIKKRNVFEVRATQARRRSDLRVGVEAIPLIVTVAALTTVACMLAGGIHTRPRMRLHRLMISPVRSALAWNGMQRGLMGMTTTSAHEMLKRCIFINLNAIESNAPHAWQPLWFPAADPSDIADGSSLDAVGGDGVYGQVIGIFYDSDDEDADL